MDVDFLRMNVWRLLTAVFISPLSLAFATSGVLWHSYSTRALPSPVVLICLCLAWYILRLFFLRKVADLLLESVLFGDMEEVECWYGKGMSGRLDYPFENGVTLLHVASKAHSISVVNFLLKEGADPLTRDDNGMNAIHWAAMHGNEMILQQLLLHSDHPYAEDRGNLCLVGSFFAFGSLLLAAQAESEEEYIVRWTEVLSLDDKPECRECLDFEGMVHSLFDHQSPLPVIRRVGRDKHLPIAHEAFMASIKRGFWEESGKKEKDVDEKDMWEELVKYVGNIRLDNLAVPLSHYKKQLWI
jgi:hypothetical protein